MTLSVTHAVDDGRSHACGPAAMGRRLRLCAVDRGRQRAPERSRYDVADQGRAVDPRSRRGAGDRHLFLHHGRPALDLDAVAGAGDVRQGLCDRGLERTGGARGCGHRPDIRAVRTAVERAPFRKRCAGVRRHRAGADNAASAGASACAGDARDGAVDRRTDRRGRPARGAVVHAAAADRAVGQPAWRLRVRPVSHWSDRAGRAGERRAAHARPPCAALGCIRLCRAGCELLHALWLERAVGLAQDPQPRQRAASDLGVAAGGFRRHRDFRAGAARRHRPCALSRRAAAGDAHRAAARAVAHGPEPGPRRRNSRFRRADGARSAAGAADRRCRSSLPPARDGRPALCWWPVCSRHWRRPR